MLSEREKDFILYWEANRSRQKKLIVRLMVGLPMGLLFSLPILLNLFSGWFKRMLRIEPGLPIVLVIGILAIGVFFALFNKQHKWEMMDQQYQELKARESRQEQA